MDGFWSDAEKVRPWFARFDVHNVRHYAMTTQEFAGTEAYRALELDFATFDYGYDREGAVVVWEANPYPHIQMSTKNLTYCNHAIHRTLAAVVKLYLTRAQLPVPAKLEAILRYPDTFNT